LCLLARTASHEIAQGEARGWRGKALSVWYEDSHPPRKDWPHAYVLSP
jgi:hypothetical protein